MPDSAQTCTLLSQGVVPEYNAMVAELEAGLSVALEVTQGADVHSRLRDFCGPAGGSKNSAALYQSCPNLGFHLNFFLVFVPFLLPCSTLDPEVARHLRPKTIRAKFGVDKICNAVHCTDLPDDQALEVEYFFSVLSA